MTIDTQSPRIAEIQRAVEARDGILKGAEWWFTCPSSQNHTNGDRKPSARWKPSELVYYCDVCVDGGGWTKLERLIVNPSSPAPTPQRPVQTPGLPTRSVSATPKNRAAVQTAAYDYHKADGTLAYQVVRYDDKSFKHRRPDPDNPGNWIWDMQGVERVPYHLPELLAADPATTVFVTEGEKDSDTLIDLGAVATTNSGGAGKWSQMWNDTNAEHFKGRPVAALADLDDSGFKHVQQVATCVSSVAAGIKVIDNYPGLEVEKADVTDWIGTGKTLEDLYALTDETAPWTAPEGGLLHQTEGFSQVVAQGFSTSIPDENEVVAVVSPFPLEVFPQAIRDYIEQGAKTVGISPDFVGVPLLAHIGGVMGNSHFLHLKSNWDVWPTFWTCIIAQTGTGKTPGNNLAEAPIRALALEAWKQWQQEVELYDADKAAARADTNLDEPINRPQLEEFISTNITIEALSDALQHGTGITVVKDEIAGWVKSFNQYRGGGGSDKQDYLSIWSNTFVKINRKGKDPIIIEKPVVNVAGGIQPEQLFNMDDEMSEGDGFLPRILFSMPYDAGVLRWTEDEIPPEYLERVIEIVLHLRRPLNEEPKAIHLSPEALSEFKTWHSQNADAQEGAHPFVRAVYAKYPQHCARFALLLHCLNHPGLPSGVEVSKDTMLQAITLTEYFRDHAAVVMRRFAEVGALTTTALTGLRAKVWGAVNKDNPEWVTAGEVRRRTGRRATADEKDAAMAALVADGYLKHEVIPTKSKGGRPTQRYRIPQANPENGATTATTPDLNLNGGATTLRNNVHQPATTPPMEVIEDDIDAPLFPERESSTPESDLPWDTDPDAPSVPKNWWDDDSGVRQRCATPPGWSYAGLAGR